jgi:hypothetical protein
MADNATVYAPVHTFPSEEQLHHLIPEASFTVDAEHQVARCELGGGVSVRLSRMPDDQMESHLTKFRGYVIDQRGGDGLAIRVASMQSVYGLVVEPGFDDDGRAMRLVSLLTGVTDGLCFRGGEVYDPAGNGLLLARQGPCAPDARRVAARATVLSAVSFRALLEKDASTEGEVDAEEVRAALVAWLTKEAELVDEIERDELGFLQTRIGDAGREASIDGALRAEGAHVLLWAVGLRELPSDDAQEHPYDVARTIGVLSDEPFTSLDAADLRGPEELDAVRRRLQSNHLRLRGESMSEETRRATSIAIERHRASNWLVGAHPTYSRVMTPT